MQTLYQRAFVAVAAAAASPWSLELKRVAAALTGSVERHHAGCLAGGEAMRTLRWQQRLPFTTKRLSGDRGGPNGWEENQDNKGRGFESCVENLLVGNSEFVLDP